MSSQSATQAPANTVGDDEQGCTDAHESWLCRAAQISEPPPATLVPTPGQVIAGKYRVEAELGRGGMGAVFRATNLLTERPVAIKWTLRPASAGHAERRHWREARAAGRVDHPNVATVYDAGQEGDAGYLVMELLRGETLRARLARGPLPATDAIALLLPAMRGVAAAHAIGVIHRDIKPDNLFIAKDSTGAESLKVLDFGVSSVRSAAGSEAGAITRDGSVLGTPAYMSPEQLDDPASCDARTDIYAFGVVLYECLSGQRPFESTSPRALQREAQRRGPIPLRTRDPSCPASVETAILTALAPDASARFDGMAQFIRALQGQTVASGAPLGQSTRTAAPASWVRSPMARFGLLGAALLCLAAIWAWMSSTRMDASHDSPDLTAANRGGEADISATPATHAKAGEARTAPTVSDTNGLKAGKSTNVPAQRRERLAKAVSLAPVAGARSSGAPGLSDPRSSRGPAEVQPRPRLRTAAARANTAASQAATPPRARAGAIHLEEL